VPQVPVPKVTASFLQSLRFLFIVYLLFTGPHHKQNIYLPPQKTTEKETKNQVTIDEERRVTTDGSLEYQISNKEYPTPTANGEASPTLPD